VRALRALAEQDRVPGRRARARRARARAALRAQARRAVRNAIPAVRTANGASSCKSCASARRARPCRCASPPRAAIQPRSSASARRRSVRNFKFRVSKAVATVLVSPSTVVRVRTSPSARTTTASRVTSQPDAAVLTFDPSAGTRRHIRASTRGHGPARLFAIRRGIAHASAARPWAKRRDEPPNAPSGPAELAKAALVNGGNSFTRIVSATSSRHFVPTFRRRS
jgi:hypothetical protein